MFVQTCNHLQLNTIKHNLIEETINKQNLFHEIDVYRVRTDDWTVNRFLSEQNDQKKAKHCLMKAINWKMQFGVYELTDDFFPRELFERGDPELFGRDKQGKYFVWTGMRNKNEPFISEMIDLNKRWFAYLIEKFDKIVHNKSFMYIHWMSGTEDYNLRKNLNFEMMKFILDSKRFYPLLVSCILLVEIPKVHATFAKCIKSIWNKMMKGAPWEMKFISSEQLTDFVDSQMIPVEMKGNRMSTIVVPANSKPLMELGNMKFTEKSYRLFYKHHESILKNSK